MCSIDILLFPADIDLDTHRQCFCCLTECALTLTTHVERAVSPGPSGVIWKTTYHPECSFTLPPCAVHFVYP